MNNENLRLIFPWDGFSILFIDCDYKFEINQCIVSK